MSNSSRSRNPKSRRRHCSDLVLNHYNHQQIITISNHSIDKPLRILCYVFQGPAKVSRLCNFFHFRIIILRLTRHTLISKYDL
ncbi:hypothetical protein MFRU_013g01060 [Monilinia fructicola]|nr:hypothetical protein MFRU_013g01060 [Monilinia fructicola]